MFCKSALAIIDPGPTYPIIEPDMREVLKKRAQGRQRELKDQVKKAYKRYLRSPIGIKLARATQHSERFVSAWQTIDNLIKTPDGKVLARPGTRINPLKHTKLNMRILFIDGDDRDQVHWASKAPKIENGISNRIVLVNGDFLEASKILKRRIFFDQRGVLVKKLGLMKLPSVVSQRGERFHVEEIAL